MAKITLESARINGTVHVGGVAVVFKNGVGETDDPSAIAQAKAAGYKVEDPNATGDDGLDVDKAAQLEQLVAQAKELGITVNGKWGIKRLTEEITKVQESH